MASEYRQLGSPRFQPQQQIGGWNYQATRDLGSEQLLKGFSNLSQSLSQAGQKVLGDEIEKAVAEGEAWRKQSQKTFREAVAAGEIHPSQNPHFAIGAMRVDGQMNARAQTTQWLGEWQAEVANPDSVAARTQGGFESFMQGKLATYEQDDPFVSHYQANAFYDITHRVIDGNAVKQNEEALGRDLVYVSKGHVDNILSLAMVPAAVSGQDVQEVYNDLYADGALTPMLKTMLLENAYMEAITQTKEDPSLYVARITGLRQGSGTLGETQEGLEAAVKYDSKLGVKVNAWRKAATEEVNRDGATYLGLHKNHVKSLANDRKRLESLIESGGDVAGFTAETIQKYAGVGAWLRLTRGESSEEYQKWLINYDEVALTFSETLREADASNMLVGAFTSYGNSTAWHDLGTKVDNRDDLVMRQLKADPNKTQAFVSILGHSTFPPLDRHFKDYTSSALRAMDSGGATPQAIEENHAGMLEAFQLYSDIRGAGQGVAVGNLFKDDDNLISQTFSEAYEALEGVAGGSHAVALSHAVTDPSPVLEAHGTDTRQGKTNAYSTPPSETEWDLLVDTIDGYENLPKATQMDILGKIREEATNESGTKDMRFKATTQKLYPDDEGFSKNYMSDGSPSLVEDPDLDEELRGEWIPASIADGINVELTEHVRGQITSQEARENLREKLGYDISFPEAQMMREIAAQVLGQYGTVPKSDDMEQWFALTTAMVDTVKPDWLRFAGEERFSARRNQMMEEFTDGLQGWFLGGEEITLEGLMDRAPQATLAWLREQDWYEDASSAGIKGWVDEENLYVLYRPDGGATIYTRDDEDSKFELYLGSAEGLTKNLTAADLKAETARFTDWKKRNQTLLQVAHGKGEVVRRFGLPADEVTQADAFLNNLVSKAGSSVGVNVGEPNFFQKVDSMISWGGKTSLSLSRSAAEMVLSDRLIDNSAPPRNFYLREKVLPTPTEPR